MTPLRGSLGVAGADDAPTVDPDWPTTWPALADLGIAGLCVDESHGGFGLRVDAATTVAIELGAALHASPFAALTAAGRSLSASGDDRAATLSTAIASGEQVCAWGRLDRTGRRACIVDGAADADSLLLVDHDGELVLLSDRAKWEVTAEHSFDVTRRCHDVSIDGEAGVRLPRDSVAESLHGLLLAADSLGGLQRMLDRTVAYAGERQAFGKAIGGFQAVQHRLVDHAVRARGMGLAVAHAADLLGAGDPEAQQAVLLAEVSVHSSATRILHDLLQLTGGIGFTWEYGLHLYERRAHQNARLTANPRSAVRALAALEGWGDAR